MLNYSVSAVVWSSLAGSAEGAVVLMKIAAIAGALLWALLTVWLFAHGVEPT